MISDQRVLAVVTARGGSKGVPGKNILPIGGTTLLRMTIDAARASRHIDRLVLSSDDPAIMQVALNAGCDVPFRRADSLASDVASSTDVVADALERLPGYSIVVLLQPTSPLRTGSDIDAALALLIRSGAPTCASIRAAQEHPYLTFQCDAVGQLVPFARHAEGETLRRQELPPAWCLNGAVYVANVEWFLRERTFLSPQTVGYVMPADRSMDIDTWADIEQLRRVLEGKKSNA